MAKGKREAKPKELTEKQLKVRQKRFVDAYLQYGSRSFLNAAESARVAGYSTATARQIGYENLTKPDIRAEIDRRLKDFSLGPEETLARLSEHARNEAGTYVKIGKDRRPAIDVAAMIEDGKQHLIKGISYTRSGDVVVETYDAQAALVHLGRHHKLFVDRTRAETYEDDIADLVRDGKATLEDVENEFGEDIAARVAARLGVLPSQSRAVQGKGESQSPGQP